MIANTFAEGLRCQGRVLLALMLREARTRYGRQRLGYLWALVEPMLHIAVFYTVFVYTLRVIPLGHSLIIFLTTGIGTYLGFQGVLDRTMGGYASNEALLAYPVVKVFDVFLGRAILELATWAVVTVLLIGSLVAIGAGPFPRSILTMMGAILALACLGFGVGIIIGIISEFVPSLGNLLRIPFRVLYFTSGLFFLPESLPPAARDFISWNPVLHGITLFRSGYYPRYDSYTLDVPYLLGWSACSLLLALVCERAARKPLRRAR